MKNTWRWDPSLHACVFFSVADIVTKVPVRSSVGQDPSWQALQVYSSKTYSFSLQGVQVQQQLTSPFRIT
jgi:hypothetical protein